MTAANRSEPRRPNLVAQTPEIAPPITHPIKALETVTPCQKEFNPKCFCKACSAPEITAVSYPKSRPPKMATKTKLTKYKLVFFTMLCL